MTDRTASPPQALETVLIEAALSDQTREHTEQRALERFYSVTDEASEAESSSLSDVALLPRRSDKGERATCMPYRSSCQLYTAAPASNRQIARKCCHCSTCVIHGYKEVSSRPLSKLMAAKGSAYSCELLVCSARSRCSVTCYWYNKDRQAR